MLEVQRTAGNRAAVELVQRQKTRGYFDSAVALATPEAIYSGKCDADLEHPSARKKWSREPLGKETTVIFECRPQSFRFSNFRPWFDTRGPWGLETADGGSAWVTSPIERALDDISDDIDDAGSKFWSGYRTIKSGLTDDLRRFCRD